MYVKSKQEGGGKRDLKPDGRKEIETLASSGKSEFQQFPWHRKTVIFIAELADFKPWREMLLVPGVCCI